MKKILTNAPLVHAVINLTFTAIPGVLKKLEEKSAELHQEMINIGFQEKISSEANEVTISFDAATQKTVQSIVKNERILFRAAGETEVVELVISPKQDISSIVIKTSSYDSFESFYKKFEEVLNVFVKVLPDLNNVLLKSVGLRYVDLIVPSENKNLNDFISSEVIPISLEMINKPQHQFGVSIKKALTDQNQQIMVAFEEVPVVNRSITKILPDQLIERDPKCGILIEGFESWSNVTSHSYGILDIDHVHSFLGSPKFDLNKIESKTSGLYEANSKVFWGVLSDTAKAAWGLQEVNDVE